MVQTYQQLLFDQLSKNAHTLTHTKHRESACGVVCVCVFFYTRKGAGWLLTEL